MLKRDLFVKYKHFPELMAYNIDNIFGKVARNIMLGRKT